MNIVGSVAIYFVCWWVTLLMVLPIGVRTQGEEGEIIPGTVASAPVIPRMGRKLLLTTVLAFIPWSLGFAILELDVLSFADFPYVPEFSND